MQEPQKSARGDVYVGDIVFAASDLQNDGTHPKFKDGGTVAETGTRGVVVKIGHPEDLPWKELFLVRFEDDHGNLGPPVGCWREELTYGSPPESVARD